jgi:hypothetical protein
MTGERMKKVFGRLKLPGVGGKVVEVRSGKSDD